MLKWGLPFKIIYMHTNFEVWLIFVQAGSIMGYVAAILHTYKKEKRIKQLHEDVTRIIDNFNTQQNAKHEPMQ